EVHAAAAWRACRTHDEEVAAELGDVLLDLLRGARADGDHGDDRGDADDDAKQCEERTQRVAAYRAHGETDGFPQHQAASAFTSSETMCPSRKVTTRSA